MKIESFKIIIIGVIFLVVVSAVLFAAKIEYLSDGGAVETANIATDNEYDRAKGKTGRITGGNFGVRGFVVGPVYKIVY